MSDQSLNPFAAWLTLPQPAPGDPQERVGDSDFPPDYFQVEAATPPVVKDHPDELPLRALVLRNLVDFLDVRLKHMAGRHNQKRHGWRYSRGAGHAGIGEEGFSRAIEITAGPTGRHLDEAKRIVAASISMRRTPEYGERMEYRKRAGIASPPPKIAKPEPPKPDVFMPSLPKPETVKPPKPAPPKPAAPTVDIPYRPDMDRQKRIYSSIDSYLLHEGVTREALRKTRKQLEDEFQKICDSNPLIVRAPFEAAEKIIRDGRFKSQFESGTSEGALSPSARKRTEQASFGVPIDIADSKRPIYGYLRGAASEDGARWYGDIRFEMKPAVRNRTTVTHDDSLGGTQIGTPLVKTNLGSLGEPYSSYSPKGIYKEGKRFRIDRNVSYFECQIHQGVTLKDVARVTFGSNAFDFWKGDKLDLKPKFAAMEAMLKAKGIEVVYDYDNL